MPKIIALSLIKIEPKKLKNVVEQLKNIKLIKRITLLTGEFDGILEIHIDDMDELFEFFASKIDTIDGIKTTNTHIVMKRFEQS
ncbi:MAG: Lrp/AsnC ligand binding domain-containing protein [Promethearchaeota archaeon]